MNESMIRATGTQFGMGPRAARKRRLEIEAYKKAEAAKKAVKAAKK